MLFAIQPAFRRVRITVAMTGNASWRRARAMRIVLLAFVAAAAFICTSSGASARSARAAAHHGTVSVLYAGSLEDVMNKRIAPAFLRATGYTLNGYPAGSSDLASEIKGKVRRGDVFISASPKVDATLQGAKNGSWVSWYAPFAGTKLVLGYNRNSRFAADLKHRAWYRVITMPGFHLGFTDPKLDPKGVLTVKALSLAAKQHHDPALKQVAASQSDLFPEQDLVGRLQAGQLDAGFFYTVEASAAKIPTVSLGSINESATYTITTLRNAPDTAGGQAFVKFLLSSEGERLLKSAGLTRVSPVARGRGVPSQLSAVIRR